MRPQMLSYLLVAVTARRLDAHPGGRPAALVAGAAHLGLGDGPRDVAGRDRDRRRRRGRAGARPADGPRAASGARCWSRSLSAVAAMLTPLGPALYRAVLGVGSRSQFFSEWNAPRLHHVRPSSSSGHAGPAVPCCSCGVAAPPWSDLAFLLVAGGCAVWSLADRAGRGGDAGPADRGARRYRRTGARRSRAPRRASGRSPRLRSSWRLGCPGGSRAGTLGRPSGTAVLGRPRPVARLPAHMVVSDWA